VSDQILPVCARSIRHYEKKKIITAKHLENNCDEMMGLYQEKLHQVNRQISAMEVVKDRLEKQIRQMTDKRKQTELSNV